MNKLVKCECGNIFSYITKVLPIDNDIKKVFFTCPTCKTDYICYYTDTEVEALQDELKALKQELTKATTDKEIKRINKKFGKIQDKLKKKMDKLRQKIERWS